MEAKALPTHGSVACVEECGIDKGNGLAQEAILFLQRLASLARNGWTRGPLQQRWESTFLEMIHSLCTSTNLQQARHKPAPSHPWTQVPSKILPVMIDHQDRQTLRDCCSPPHWRVDLHNA